jgi:hypothetical protein
MTEPDLSTAFTWNTAQAKDDQNSTSADENSSTECVQQAGVPIKQEGPFMLIH